MNLRCFYCQTPFTLGMDEKVAALRKMHAENLHHYDAICPRCRRANPVSRERLEMFTPGWEAAIAASGEPAAPPAPATPAPSMPAPVMEKTEPALPVMEKEAAPVAPPRRKHAPAARKAAAKAKPAPKKKPAAKKAAAKPKAKPKKAAKKSKPAAKKPAAKKTKKKK